MNRIIKSAFLGVFLFCLLICLLIASCVRDHQNLVPVSDNITDNSSLSQPIFTQSVTRSMPKSSETDIDIVSATDTSKILEYYDKKVIVEGFIVEIGELAGGSEGKNIILYMDSPYSHTVGYQEYSIGQTGSSFAAIIKSGNVLALDNICFYFNRKVRITGKIDIYHGRPVIYLNDLQQISVADAPPPEPDRSTLKIVAAPTTEYVSNNPDRNMLVFDITNTNSEWGVLDLYYGSKKIALFIPSESYMYDCVVKAVTGREAIGSESYPVTKYSNNVKINIFIKNKPDNEDIMSEMQWKWIWLPSKPHVD